MKAMTNIFRKPMLSIALMFFLGFSIIPLAMNGQGSLEDDSSIVCHCNFWGRCKASGSRANCAVGNPNVNCQDYNGNC